MATMEYIRYDNEDQGNKDVLVGTHAYTTGNLIVGYCYYEGKCAYAVAPINAQAAHMADSKMSQQYTGSPHGSWWKVPLVYRLEKLWRNRKTFKFFDRLS